MIVGLLLPKGKPIGVSSTQAWRVCTGPCLSKLSLLTDPILLGHPPSNWDVKGFLSLSCILVPPTSVLFLPLPKPAWFHRLESFRQNVLPKKHHLVDKLIRLRVWAVVIKLTKVPLLSNMMGTGAHRVPL